MSVPLELLHIRVAAPAVSPRPFGLFSVAPPLSPSDPRWTAGVTFDSMTCVGINVWTDECFVGREGGGPPQPPSSPKLLSDCADVTWADFKAYTVYAAVSRSAGAGRDVATMARTALLNGEQSGAEAGLWAQMVVAAGAPVSAASPLLGLAAVEQSLAMNYHGLGVIHMDPSTATQLGAVLSQRGSQIVTPCGTPVVVGAGYAG